MNVLRFTSISFVCFICVVDSGLAAQWSWHNATISQTCSRMPTAHCPTKVYISTNGIIVNRHVDKTCQDRLGPNAVEFEPSTNQEVTDLINVLDQAGLNSKYWIKSTKDPKSNGPSAFNWRREAVEMSLWFTARFVLTQATAGGCTVLITHYGGFPSSSTKHMLGTIHCSSSAQFICTVLTNTTISTTNTTTITTTTTTRQPQPRTTPTERKETPSTSTTTSPTQPSNQRPTTLEVEVPELTRVPTVSRMTTTLSTTTEVPQTTKIPITTQVPSTETTETTQSSPSTTTEEISTATQVPSTETSETTQSSPSTTTDEISTTTQVPTTETTETAHSSLLTTTPTSTPTRRISTRTRSKTRIVHTSIPVIVCPCACPNTSTIPQNVSDKQVQEMTTKLQRDLTVDRDGLSTTVRKKTSAQDSGLTSQIAGIVGITLMSLTYGFIVALDTAGFRHSVYIHVKSWMRQRYPQ